MFIPNDFKFIIINFDKILLKRMLFLIAWKKEVEELFWLNLNDYVDSIGVLNETRLLQDILDNYEGGKSYKPGQELMVLMDLLPKSKRERLSQLLISASGIRFNNLKAKHGLGQ